jgi:PadR family transcriptional regulator PadR
LQDLKEHTDAWRSQLRKGSLELAVLLALRRTPRYGLALVEHLNGHGLGVSDGSIYPLLARLRGEEKVVAEWVDEGAGHAHKVYRLTRRGEAACQAMLEAWRDFAAALDRVVDDAPPHGRRQGEKR